MELHDPQAEPQAEASQTLNQSEPQEAAATNEETQQPAAETAVQESTPAIVAKALSKEEIVAMLEQISERDGADINRDEVTRLKQQFYALMRHEIARQTQPEAETDDDEVKAVDIAIDPADEHVRRLLETIKEKKAAYIQRLEAERAANLEKKQAIIAELGQMAEDTDNVNRHYQRFRELSAQFKETGEVPPTEQTDLWRTYQAAVERFYDQLKVNKDLRDYDFRKNLEQKELLIAEAVKLNDSPDVVTAFRRLQELHDKWREVGPVAKEQREEIWARFKDASAEINKRYQAFFEERKARERENEEKKTALCERVEAIDLTTLRTNQAWEQATADVLAAQEEWKKLGFASKKVNNTLFARFRKRCDEFFTAKSEHFKGIRDTHAANLEKKTALCERAEAIMDSTDWRKTGDEFAALQAEWKTVGPVERKYSDAVWRRFLAAADHFFDRRKKATSGQRKAEHAALKAKNAIIDALKQVDTSDHAKAVAAVKELMAQWQQEGHVPYKDKDRLHEAYRAEINRLYDTLDMNRSRQNMTNFAANIEQMDGDAGRLGRERERLARAIEGKRSELKTYENNIGFFSVSSKSGSSLLRDMERKMQRLKDELATLQEKLKLIDSKL